MAAQPLPPPPRAAPATPRPGPVDMLVRHLDEPLHGGNRVTLRSGPPEADAALFALLHAVDGARDHVNLESWPLDDAAGSQVLADRLAERARRGVRVNLLHDAAGPPATEWLAALRSAGAWIGGPADAPRWRPWGGSLPATGERPRLVLVDGRLGFVGGAMPASAEPPLRGLRDPAGWRQLQLQLEGPAVHRLQRLFIDHATEQAERPLPEARYFPPLTVAGTQRFVLSAREGGRARTAFGAALLAALGAARERVLLAPAHRPWPRTLVQALLQAAARGVRVELVAPAAQATAAPSALQAAGIPVHALAAGAAQAPLCVIDGLWTSLGSANAEDPSARQGGECDVVVLDEDFAGAAEARLRQAVVAGRAPASDSGPAGAGWRRAAEVVSRRLGLHP